MPQSQFVSVTDPETGIIFVFKRDPDDPELLHIYARHLTTSAVAIETFHQGRTTWNVDRERFETYTRTHGLYWFWRVENRVVMVISCFTLEEEL